MNLMRHINVFMMTGLLLCLTILTGVGKSGAQHVGHDTHGHASHATVPQGGEAGAFGQEILLSDTAKRLIQLETAPVERKWVTREVRLVGKIDYDETRLKHITAWVSGRVDRLYVNYTGIRVNQGDHMVSLYSPELLSAQEELIQAARSLDRLRGSTSTIVKRSSERSVQAARDKLRLLGLTSTQVGQIEKRGQADEQVTIYAPIGGIVVEKQINEGMYVDTGTEIYTIADLSRLWLYLDAYESDLPWLRYGQQVAFQAEAFPGEEFHGVVSFVQPFLDERTRTVRVRVNVENPDLRLKPGLFITATIQAQISDQGTVVGPSYTGQYICPMHPEVIREVAGNCSICGMTLVLADSLPLLGHSHEHRAGPPLVIPASAPLITGKRAIVYVQKPDTGTYEGRTVTLGPRAGDYYVVKAGVHEGERVVSSGSFKIDADLQIQGKRSMMNPHGGRAGGTHAH